MERSFDETGVYHAGRCYGHFSGTAEWSHDGTLEVLHLEQENFDGQPLTLDLDELLRERTALEKRYGSFASLSDLLHREKAFLTKWSLFWGLSASLDTVFAEDIAELRAEPEIREFEAVG